MIELDVYNMTHAQDLAEALRCTNSSQFTVIWHGSIFVPHTLSIGNSTVVKITGMEDAVIWGGESTQLFSITSGATLSIHNTSLGKGGQQKEEVERSMSMINLYLSPATANSLIILPAPMEVSPAMWSVVVVLSIMFD